MNNYIVKLCIPANSLSDIENWANDIIYPINLHTDSPPAKIISVEHTEEEGMEMEKPSMTKKKQIILDDPSTWKHLVKNQEELTEEEKNRVFCFHATTGGDMYFLKNGEVVYQ